MAAATGPLPGLCAQKNRVGFRCERGARRPTIRPVHEVPRTWLEVDLDQAGISGLLHDADESPVAFSGWLGLVAAVEAARERHLVPAADGEEAT